MLKHDRNLTLRKNLSSTNSYAKNIKIYFYIFTFNFYYFFQGDKG